MSATGRMDRNWGSAQSAHVVKLLERSILEKKPLMETRLQVVVGAGTMMAGSVRLPLPRIGAPGGVTVEADFTGGYPLQLATAGCVLI